MSKFRVSLSFYLLSLVMIFLGRGYQLLSYAVAVVMHEFAHAELSRRRGYTLDGIILKPYGASLTGAFEGVTARDEIAIALVGPLSNVVIAVVFLAIWWLAPATFFFTETFVVANIFTGITNLIPVFPLDGGRALLAAISLKIPRQKAYKIMRIGGFILSGFFVVLFSVSMFFTANISFAIIGIFVFLSTIFPDKNSAYQRIYSVAYRYSKIRRGLQIKEVMVDGDATLLQLNKMLNANFYHRFIVVNDKMQVVASISETNLEELLAKNDWSTSLKKLLPLPK